MKHMPAGFPQVMARPYLRSRAALIACIGALAACAHSPSPAQRCGADHTPVVDGKWNPLGCNEAKRNKISVGASCEQFAAGARTTDVTGATYECKEQ